MAWWSLRRRDGLGRGQDLTPHSPTPYIREVMRAASYYFAYFWFSPVTGGQREANARS